MADEPLQSIFGRPFAEQLVAYRARLGELVPTDRWDDIEKQMHDRAFMVAGAKKADLLEDLAQAVDRVIAKGIGLEEFKKDFFGIAEANGWSGWTGDGTKAGRHWRARVIYRTNMRATYAAGRMAHLRAKRFKYWVYRHGGSLEPREQHLGWDGLILPAEHPFWATHAPPNGWGCSCYILGARSMAHAQRLGGDPGKDLPTDWKSLDPKTGVIDGIDKGWDYAPGASVSDLINALAPKLKLLPDLPSIDLIQHWLRGGAFADWILSPAGFWPLARLRQKEALDFGLQRPTVFLSPDTLAKQLQRHPELSVQEYQKVQAILDAPTERIFDGPRSVIYVSLDPQDRNYALVVKIVQQANEVFVTSYRRFSSNPEKLRVEIARLRRKGN